MSETAREPAPWEWPLPDPFRPMLTPKGEKSPLEEYGMSPTKRWEEYQAQLRRERGEPEPEPPKRGFWARLFRRGNG